ncbi:hypothetical protein GGF31_006094 [Allomyces arbusculus]|nr:hypothetical protein GGF31_006094 [Allomyces arbusculus]
MAIKFSWMIIAIPMTLVELELDDAVLPSSDDGIQHINLPLSLRKFTLKELARRDGNNAAASKVYG